MEISSVKRKQIWLRIILVISIIVIVAGIFIYAKLKDTIWVTFPELEGKPQVGQWYAITPDGTKSSDGSKWHGFLRTGNENKVMVYFFGGGASISEYTAAHSKDFYAADIKNQDFMATIGISSNAEENPFKDWTILILPYSTGDFHSGTGEFTYSDDNGNEKVLYHNGYNNMVSFLKEAIDYTGTPDTLLVTGFSAGGFATSLLADDVIDYFPSATNITVAVDSSLMLNDQWHDISENIWESPTKITEKLTTDNLVLDSLIALHEKRGESVKILFDCSVRDGELARWQSYLDQGEMTDTEAGGDKFQANLKKMVEGLQSNIPDAGIYIWDGIPYKKDSKQTLHTIIYSNAFDEMNGGVSIADWIYSAVNGDIQQYGLELLDKEY